MPPTFDRLIVNLPYQWSNPITAPPASKSLRANSLDPTTITIVWLSFLTLITDDAYLVLMQLPAGATLYVQDHDDHTTFLELQLTALPIDRGTYVELPVVYVAHGGTVVGNNQDLLCLFFAPDAVVEPPVPPEPLPSSALIIPPWAQPKSAYSVLTTPPIIEPLTVAEAKLRAGLDWPTTDPREALVPSYIAAARSMVERDTGLALLTQGRDVYFWPYDPTLPLPLPAQATPLQQITVFESWAPGAPLPPVQLEAFAVDFIPRPLSTAAVEIPAGAGVHMQLIVGWPDVASLQAQAPLLIQAVGLLVAHMLTLGRDAALTGSAIAVMPYGYDDCVGPHRLVWMA